MAQNRILICAIITLLTASVALGDHVILKDGRKFTGTVTRQTEHMVQIRTADGNLLSFPILRVSEVKTDGQAEATGPATTTQPAEEVQTGPKYFVVPLAGMVGKEITADKITEAFKIGLADPQTILVLDMDSPGGLINECEKIVSLMGEQRDRRTIAYVRSAYSAAAIITLTCDEIYMHRDASIGAATAYASTPWGPADVAEKMQSVWRSICRKAADMGGHNPLIPEAMVDSNMQLRRVEKDGKIDVEQTMRIDEKDLRENLIVTKRGKLLTMTAKEAVACGLAVGIVANFDEVAEKANLAGWHHVSEEGRQMMSDWTSDVAKAEEHIKKLKKDAEKAWNLAVNSDPNRGSYMVDGNGNFTSASRKAWLSNSKKCYDYLKYCEDFLGQIIKYGQKFPAFEGDAEWAEEQKSRVNTQRMAIKDGASRRGI